jgi:putative transposase
LHAIRTAGAETEVALLAYCFMPDHVHLLAEGMTDRADARAFMILAKKRSGIAYSRRTRKPLWQEGYYDRVLRAGDDVRAVARYMLNNPVRAGLVRHPFEYPHLGSDRWSLVELVEAIS